MKQPIYEATLDRHLFDELYGVQPQAITWLRPMWNDDRTAIVDFEYVYSNNESLSYLNLTAEQHDGLRVSTTPTLSGPLRQAVLDEMIGVYLNGVDSKTTIYNPALNKYARVLRTRLRDGVLSIVQDRTEENRIIKQLEEQARELEAQKTLLDSVLKNSSNGISVSQVFRDENGKVVDALTILANDAAVKYIGLPREIYLTKRATEIEPEIIGSPYYQACINTLETGQPFVMQYYMQATDRWLELTVSKLDYNHLIQVFSDVTPIKEVQLQLEKAAFTLRTVFDAAKTGMFTFSPVYNEKEEIIDFRFVMVNSTISEYAGMAPETLEGQLGTAWFPGYLTNGEFDMHKRCFETGEPQRTEIHYIENDREFYLDMQTVRIDSQLLVTLTDYSSLRKSQSELEKTIQALERTNMHLEDFAHAASHDMKEPLRKIHTFIDRLKQKLVTRLDEAESSLFDRIEAAADRMQLLVDDLLEFSFVSQQTQKLEFVDLNEKMKKILSDLEISIEEKQAQIKVGSLPTVLGNRRQLQQLFQNLVGNALKYSKKGITPVVEITSQTIAGEETGIRVATGDKQKLFYLIEVKDNGIGFEQQYADRIFHIFTRLHGRNEYAGTGVGLAIVQKVVQNHKGYIAAYGDPGNGASFKVLLPAS
ncbi:MAG: PAS domain-containing sensor histidine kinase [Chitinophagaceae bacterium]|nr:MAG: PAS domain-containing sensor histidine kinase [Chitinophagaceae bacterium]